MFPVIILLLLGASSAWAAPGATVSGRVVDPTGASLAHAHVALVQPPHIVVRATDANDSGEFRLENVRPGKYVLEVLAAGFSERRMPISVSGAGLSGVEVRLELATLTSEVTVTAARGSVEEPARSTQAVNVISAEEIMLRAKAVVAQAMQEAPGIHLQRTSPSMAGVYVRGLTGNKVNVFVDGVRYTTAAQRGGVNTFLDLIDPAMLDTIEVVRGPSSAQYGSDALGGSLQLLTRSPELASGQGVLLRGIANAWYTSADQSFGSQIGGTLATERAALMLNAVGRRVNPIRTGGGIDSHGAVTRFLGVPSTVIGRTTLPDTAFTQYGGSARAQWAPVADAQLVASYSRGHQDGAKRYDQLLGGDGNSIADLRDLRLDFGYARFEKTHVGWFDRMSGAYSINMQHEERVNQGGNGNPRAAIAHEPETMTVHGAQMQAARQFGTTHQLTVGGDFYHERADAASFSVNPVTGIVAPRRGRIPDGARYDSGGVFAQHSVDVIPGRLEVLGSVRGSGAAYSARAADSPFVDGARLWPDDELQVGDVTYRAGAVGELREGLTTSFTVARGFRAPHITDLGTLGLTGSGFEVAAPDVQGLGATVGTRADRQAVSTGRPVEQVKPETSVTWEGAVHYRHERLAADAWVFVNDIGNGIDKAALIVPAGSVGVLLGGQPVTSQTSDGAVFVASSSSPVLVRGNMASARVRGVEFQASARLANTLVLRALGTAMHAENRATGEPPAIEGGTPAPEMYLTLKYVASSGRYWAESYMHVAAAQDRLSTLDLEDRRIGATRGRASIRNFFLNGATARGLVGPGPDAVFGTTDDQLLATGETLAQIQDRVLGSGVDAAPLFTKVPGYATIGVRGGVRINPRHDLLIDGENLTDRNYRGISWGMDAPGRSLSVMWRTRF